MAKVRTKRAKGQSRHASVPSANIQRSTFDRSHGHKTTFDAGLLIPIYVDEALPGDTMSLRVEAFARLATPVYPIMDALHLTFFFFAIPYRLVWDNWEKFNGQQDNPADSIDFLLPQIFPSGAPKPFAEGEMSDYMGLPTAVDDIGACSLWHRSYNLTYNEWFRSQDLTDSAVIDRGDGPDETDDYPLRKRTKRPDYFVSGLPWPQKGDAVEISLLGTAPLTLDDAQFASVESDDTDPTFVRAGVTTTLDSQITQVNANFGAAHLSVGPVQFANSGLVTSLDSSITGVTDLTGASAVTINALRLAATLQQYSEKDAWGGTRYTEKIRTHFGVTSPDARLQRPEYLGGGSTVMNVQPVPQTSSTDATSPQGNLSGYITASAGGIGFNHSFTEHCCVLGLVCLTADITYQEGMRRMFSRRTVEDMYWPTFQNLGEQAILSKEIYMDGTAADDDVFAYIPRWDEYRSALSLITGRFRSNFAQSLDPWHTAQHFDDTRPLLNTTFIEETPPMDRIIAVADEPDILFDSWFQIHHARPMPTYSRPGIERL